MWSLVRNPENLKENLLGLGVLAVLLAVAYFMADSNAVYNAAGSIESGGEEGSAVNQWVGAGIWYSVILRRNSKYIFCLGFSKRIN